MKFLIAIVCALAVATASSTPTGGARERRHLVTPVVYSAGVSAVHTPVVAHNTYAYPYVTHTAHPVLYRARRDVYAPVAYHGAINTPVLAHTYPNVAHTAYSYPHVSQAAYLYRKRRDVVAYHGSVHTPVVAHTYPQVAHTAYSYPHVPAHTAYLYRKRRDIVAPVVYSYPTYHAYPTTYGHYNHYY